MTHSDAESTPSNPAPEMDDRCAHLVPTGFKMPEQDAEPPNLYGFYSCTTDHASPMYPERGEAERKSDAESMAQLHAANYRIVSELRGKLAGFTRDRDAAIERLVDGVGTAADEEMAAKSQIWASMTLQNLLSQLEAIREQRVERATGTVAHAQSDGPTP